MVPIIAIMVSVINRYGIIISILKFNGTKIEKITKF